MGDVSRIILNQVIKNGDLATLRIDRANDDVWFVSDSPEVKGARYFTSKGEGQPNLKQGPKSIITLPNPNGAYALFYIRPNLVEERRENVFRLLDEWLVDGHSFYLTEFPQFAIPLSDKTSGQEGGFAKSVDDSLLYSSRIFENARFEFEFEITRKNTKRVPFQRLNQTSISEKIYPVSSHPFLMEKKSFPKPLSY